METTLNALVAQFGYTGNHAALLANYAADGRDATSLTSIAETIRPLSAYCVGLMLQCFQKHERAQAHGWRAVSPRTIRWEQLTGITAHECPPCKRHHMRHGEVPS